MGEKGILEQSQITFVSTSDNTLQDEDRTDGEETEGDKDSECVEEEEEEEEGGRGQKGQETEVIEVCYRVCYLEMLPFLNLTASRSQSPH